MIHDRLRAPFSENHPVSRSAETQTAECKARERGKREESTSSTL